MSPPLRLFDLAARQLSGAPVIDDQTVSRAPGTAEAAVGAHAAPPAFTSYCPLTEAPIPGLAFTPASPAQIQTACANAAAAFAAWKPHVVRGEPLRPGYHDAQGQTRAIALRSLAQRLREVEPELLCIAGRETGLSRVRLARELVRTVATLELFSQIALTGSWREEIISEPSDATPLPAFNARLHRFNVPLGPVAVFTASNFPLAYGVAGGDVASALACGCPVIVKGHPAHPATGEFLARLVVWACGKAGLEPGWFSFLQSGGPREREIGIDLISNPAIAAAGFTGSIAGGEALRRTIFERRPHSPIPLFAENGSCNIVVVLREALRTRGAQIARDLAISITDSTGQQCTNTGLVLLEADEANPADNSSPVAAFVRTLQAALTARPSRPMLSPRIAASYRDRVLAVCRACGIAAPPLLPGTRAAPAILPIQISDWLTHETVRQEIFGPCAVLASCPVPLAASAIRAGNGMLVGSVYYEQADAPSRDAILPELLAKAGRVVCNGVPTGVRVTPAMVHGGPHPATSAPESTAVGPLAARRWCRPVCLQGA